MKLGIAERFLSIQGEGYYTGTPMYFIRLAGCSVGKVIPGGNPSYVEKCTLYDGREFLCDTNFRRTEILSVEEILEMLPYVHHVNITGGEPFNQHVALKELVEHLDIHKKVHIETSGTVDVPWILEATYDDVWITVSPKLNVKESMLRRANEIKFLVDNNFSMSDAEKLVKQHCSHDTHIWLQPVNKENELDVSNVKRCIELLLHKPLWKLSLQLHKVLGVR